MSEQIAFEAMRALDNDRMTVQLSVRQITNVIHDYIPRACLREVEDLLFEALFVSGTELVSNNLRKEYEAWKKIELPFMQFKP